MAVLTSNQSYKYLILYIQILSFVTSLRADCLFISETPSHTQSQHSQRGYGYNNYYREEPKVIPGHGPANLTCNLNNQQTEILDIRKIPENYQSVINRILQDPISVEIYNGNLTLLKSTFAYNLQYCNIYSINLTKNYIREIEPDFFNKLNTLAIIILNYNNITEISLDKLYLLNYFSINHNILTKVNITSLSLLEIDISFNNITNIDLDLPKLNTIKLNNNQLTELQSDVFDKLPSLTHFNLSKNNLKSLPSGVFHKLNELLILDLSENKLTEIKQGMFFGLSKLYSLYLQGNQLKTINIHAFHDLTNLHVLNISYNNLLSLEIELFTDLILDNIVYISLHNNAWKCDNLLSIKKVCKLNNITIEPGHSKSELAINGIVCTKDSFKLDEKINATESKLLFNKIDDRQNTLKDAGNIISNQLKSFFDNDFKSSALYNFFQSDFKQTTFSKYFNKDFKDSSFFNFFEQQFLNISLQSIIKSVNAIEGGFNSSDVEALVTNITNELHKNYENINNYQKNIDNYNSSIAEKYVDVNNKTILIIQTSCIILFLVLYCFKNFCNNDVIRKIKQRKCKSYVEAKEEELEYIQQVV